MGHPRNPIRSLSPCLGTQHNLAGPFVDKSAINCTTEHSLNFPHQLTALPFISAACLLRVLNQSTPNTHPLKGESLWLYSLYC